jgi:hypothetical protein
MLNDLTSGFNIADNLTLDLQYNEMLGFTHEEVQQLMKETGVNTDLITIDLGDYYNGYKFHEDGENTLYNPAMIMAFLKQILKNKKIPRNLVDENLKIDNSRLQRIIENAGNRNNWIEIVKNNGTNVANIISQFPLNKMYSNEYFVSLLFYMGLLTIDNFQRGKYYLKIPNYSVQTLYWEYLVEIISNDNNVKIDQDQLCNAVEDLAYNGKLQPYIDYVSQHILLKLANRDLIHFDEKYVKFMLLMGLYQSTLYKPTSEKEVENGYIDIFLNRSPSITDVKYEWAWEIKYLKVKDANEIKNKKQEAVKQLEKYKQSALLKDKANVKYAAIIFIGKDQYEICEVE